MNRTRENIRIIFEGHYFTMKSSLVKHLTTKYNIPFLSGEWMISEELTNDFHSPNIIMPQSMSKAAILESYDLIIRLLYLFPSQPFLIDRFHLSLQFYDMMFNTDYYSSDIEDKLAAMNTVVVYCRSQLSSYKNMLNSRLRDNSHKGNIYPLSYDTYCSEEEAFERIARNTKLPLIYCDVSGKTVDQIETELVKSISELRLIDSKVKVEH